MRRIHSLAFVAVLALALSARADLTVQIGNGDKVDGSIGPTETETFLIDVPAGSKLTVTAKGKKAGKGTKPPVVSVEVRDSEGALVVGSTKSKAAKAKVTVTKTDTYSVSVTSTDTGNYQIKIKWKAPKKEPVALTFGDTPDEKKITFDADSGALLTMKVKPSKRSAADPRFDRLDNDGGSEVLPAPDPGEKGHTIKRYAVDTFGAQCLFAANDGPGGDVKGSVKIKAPKSQRRKIDVRDQVIGPETGDDEGIGVIVTPGDGGLVEAGAEQGAIDGAAVEVPPGAVLEDTVVVVATAPELVPPAGDGLGPTVFFGPEGLVFESLVTVQLPFDPAALAGDFDDLEIYTRDAEGNISLVPGPYDLADAASGIISVQVSGFSSYVVAGPEAGGQFDLNGDGIDDFVVPAPSAGISGQGELYVFFGPPANGSDTDDADVIIEGQTSLGEFGASYHVGDVDDDGIADLLAATEDDPAGQLLIFLGGPGFNPDGVSDADFTITGEVADDSFGEAVALGDVNGDGITDLICGAESGGGDVGRVYVFLGVPESTFTSLAANADAKITGQTVGGLFGSGIGIGDVDESGVDDIVVGADAVDTVSDPGAVYVFFGGNTGQIVDRSASTRNAYFMGSDQANNGFGRDIVVGDVTGDGTPDIITNNGADTTNSHPGEIFVFEGTDDFPSGDANAQAFRKYTGFGANDRLGFSLRLAPLGPAGELVIVATAPAYAGGRGGLFLFGAPLPSSGTVVNGTGVALGENAGDDFRVLLDPIVIGGVSSIGVGASEFGQSRNGRVYVFTTPPAGEASAATADIIIDGLAGERIGGDGD